MEEEKKKKSLTESLMPMLEYKVKSPLNLYYPQNFKMKLRCMYYNMYEEIYMTLILIGALSFPTPFATTVSLLAMMIVFLKPYLSISLKYIIQIVICSMILLYSIFALYVKIDKISKINFDKGFIDSIYKAIFGKYEKDQGYVLTFIYEIIVLFSATQILFFSIKM